MRVQWQLRRLSTLAPATALLLVSDETADLLQLAARLGLDPLPPIIPTAEGFLVRLPQPTTQVVSGTIRLRSLADNLLLPVDAELVPSLLPDEAFGLVKNRGLVFLPGGRVLEFHPKEPLSLSDLLTVPLNETRVWKPLPDPMPLADRITDIVLDLPLAPADELLEGGREEIGLDPARPPDSSPVSKSAGRTTLGLGKALMRIGDFLHIAALSRFGANLMAGALTLAPRLSEKLLGAQEAALRALLREFREGNQENALRRALPLGDQSIRGGVAAGNARLPFHNLRYSLQKLLGGRPGPAHFWFGGIDVWGELDREYRKQAELATQRGDYRRAAFIYAKLLADYRLAARVLERGGLYADAAAIYLQKLQDSLAAAQAFESGGDFDRALDLYRQRGDHERAGDLLQRIGEEEAALAEFEAAAEKLIENHRDYLRAGDLMLTKAHRSDLGLRYFEAGWASRPLGSPVPCALRMARLYASSESPQRLLELLSQAESFLANAEAGLSSEFYNGIAELANDPHLAGLRDELLDRALLGIAAKMRQWAGESIAPGRIVSVLMGQSSAWSAPVVSDAAFAAKTEAQRAVSSKPAAMISGRSLIPGANPIVTAACWTHATGEVFLGFASGEIVRYSPSTGEFGPLPIGPFLGNITIYGDEVRGTSLFKGDPVTCLATNPKAQLVIGLTQREEDSTAPSPLSPGARGQGERAARLMSFVRRPNDGFVLRESRSVPVSGLAWLTPVVTHDGHHVGVWTGEVIDFLSGAGLVPFDHWEPPSALSDIPFVAGLLLAGGNQEKARLGLLLLGAGFACHLNDFSAGATPPPLIRLGWTPSVPEGSTLASPQLAVLQTSTSDLELAGIANDGCLYWSRIGLEDDGNAEVTTICSRWPQSAGYSAAAIIRSGLVAGVKKDGIVWLACGAKEFSKRNSRKIDFPAPVACFPHYRGNELIVIGADGTLGRVPFLG